MFSGEDSSFSIIRIFQFNINTHRSDFSLASRSSRSTAVRGPTPPAPPDFIIKLIILLAQNHHFEHENNMFSPTPTAQRSDGQLAQLCNLLKCGAFLYRNKRFFIRK